MVVRVNGSTGIVTVSGTSGAPSLRGPDGNSGISFDGDQVIISSSGLVAATFSDSAATINNLSVDTTTFEFSPGSSGTPTVAPSGDLNTGIYFPAADTIGFAEGGNEAGRFDSSGRLGIGTTNPTEPLTLGFADLGSARIGFRSASYSQIAMIEGSHDSGTAEGSLRFWTRSGGTEAERMRILSTGHIGFGCTARLGQGGIFFRQNTSNGAAEFTWNRADTALDSFIMLFHNNTNTVGSISHDNVSTAYNTSSDYRLKENIVDLDGAIDRVKQLLPRRFNFLANPARTVDGFIAHEAQAVVPEAVKGTHNEVEVWKESEELPNGVSVGDNKLDEDGNTIPKYQGIDQSKLVPLLTAALQEAIGKIEALETANASQAATIAALDARLASLESA